MPACLALSSDGTIAFESFAVIMKPLAPAEIRFSIAVTWDSLSPSCLPAKVCSCTPAFCASAVAPSFIFTKNGLVSVLVIRPTIAWPPEAPPEAPEPPELELDPPPPQAASTRVAVRPVASTAARRPPGEMGFLTRCDLSSSSTGNRGR